MILFRNPGSIDLRGLTTFGLSSKDESAIGRFGTGLKYATAVIARHEGRVDIWDGSDWHVIGSRDEEFRGRTIRQLTLDGNDLPFTTDLGKDWEPWMAFRELYANALDEGGNVDRVDQSPEAHAEETVIAVQLDAFEAIFFSMEEHFIGQDEDPIWSSPSMDIYPGRSPFIFYRGIAIQKLKQPAAYRYNLKGYVDLTEDRTAKYSWQTSGRITEALISCDDTAILAAAIDQRNKFEAKLDFSDCTSKASAEFLGTTVELGVNSNPTAQAVVKAQVPDSACTTTIIQKGQPGAEELRIALGALRRMGADLSKAKFVLADGVPIIGDFDVRGDAIFLAESIFENQRRMTLACVEGYAGVIGNHWLATRLIDLTDDEEEAA